MIFLTLKTLYVVNNRIFCFAADTGSSTISSEASEGYACGTGERPLKSFSNGNNNFSQTTFREIDRTYQVDQLSVNRVEAQCSSFKNVFEIIL